MKSCADPVQARVEMERLAQKMLDAGYDEL
jgi:hypothetical protein